MSSNVRSLFIFLLLYVAVNAYGQEKYSISGTVTDDNGQTLPGATVFLTGTKIITACDNSGMFHLVNISPGTYQIAVKMVGFTPEIVPVILKDGSLSLVVVLKAKTNQISEVNISFDPDWEGHFAEFKEKFLGTTPNASECKILNPKVLHFRYSKRSKKLTASAEDFIIIENDALGYKISYLLNNFEYDDSKHILKYEGSPSFQELTPKSDKQLRKWKENREAAYKGSITHFMKSVYDGDVYGQGFEVYKVINKHVGESFDQGKPMVFDNRPVAFDSLLTVVDSHFKSLAYKDCLYVIYAKEKEAYPFKNSGYEIQKPVGARISNGQSSMINLMYPEVTIDVNGNFSRPDALLFEGYMAWEQIADLMPLEYGNENN